MSDSLFKQIKDANEAVRFLKEAPKELAASTIWTRNQEILFDGNITHYLDSSAVITVAPPKNFRLNNFTEELKKKGIRECYFSVTLPKAKVFFKAMFVSAEAGALKFRVLDKMYKVQRRRDIRFPVPRDITLKVEYNDPLYEGSTITRKVLDISQGGLSFLVDESDELLYPKGLELAQMTFSVRSKKIICPGEVRYAKPYQATNQNPGIRVGIRFLKLSPDLVAHLQAYVMEESRKYFTMIDP